MNNQEMLDFLMEHDVTLTAMSTKKTMTADESESATGEFIVLNALGTKELYRGSDFNVALKVLELRI
jgi:hypothetical protein